MKQKLEINILILSQCLVFISKAIFLIIFTLLFFIPCLFSDKLSNKYFYIIKRIAL